MGDSTDTTRLPWSPVILSPLLTAHPTLDRQRGGERLFWRALPMNPLPPFRAVFVLMCSLLATFAARAESAAQAPKPQSGRWGFDAAGADPATKPGDNFFRYANGKWVDQTKIPADKPSYSLRIAMSDLTERRLHDLMEQAATTAGHEPATTAGKVGAFYKSFMDEARVAQLGATPLAAHLAAVTPDKIAALMGRNDSDFEGSLFALGIDIDLKDPKRYAVYAGQAGLGLPDRDYYLEPSFAAKKRKDEAYRAELSRHLGGR